MTYCPGCAAYEARIAELEAQLHGRDPGRADVRSIFNYWREQCGHPQARLTADRRRKVLARLSDGYDEQFICRAIDGAAKHAYVNDRGVRFDDLELICRNGSKLELFEQRGRVNPNGFDARLLS